MTEKYSWRELFAKIRDDVVPPIWYRADFWVGVLHGVIGTAILGWYVL